MRSNQQHQQGMGRDFQEGNRDRTEDLHQNHDFYDQEADPRDQRGRDFGRQANQRRGRYNPRGNRSRSRESREVRFNPNRLSAIAPQERLVGLALRADPNLSNRDQWAQRPEMREVESDNSANNSHREFDQRDGPVNNFVASSNLNFRNNDGHTEVHQQNQNQEDRRETMNVVIPERNVQFRENRNQVLEAGDICRICGDVHTENLFSMSLSHGKLQPPLWVQLFWAMDSL
jgi:hypothetical protein